MVTSLNLPSYVRGPYPEKNYDSGNVHAKIFFLCIQVAYNVHKQQLLRQVPWFACYQLRHCMRHLHVVGLCQQTSLFLQSHKCKVPEKISSNMHLRVCNFYIIRVIGRPLEQECPPDFSTIFETAQKQLNFDIWALFYLRNIPSGNFLSNVKQNKW